MSSINTNSIAHLISIVNFNLLEKNRTIPGLDNILVKDGKLYYHNGDSFFVSDVDITDDFCVNAKDFCNFYSKVSGEITAKLDDNKLKLSSNKTKASLNIMDSKMIEDRISAMDLNDIVWNDDAEIFNSYANFIINEVDNALAGIVAVANENNTILIATDRIRILRQDFNVVLPRNFKITIFDAKKVISKAEWVGWSIKNNMLILKSSDGIIAGTPILPDVKFPSQAVINSFDRLTNVETIAECKLPDNFAEILTRGGIFSSSTSTSSSEVVQLKFTSTNVEITSINGKSSISDVLDFDTPQNIPEEISFWMSKSFLLEAYNKCNQIKIHKVSVNQKVVEFTDGKFRELISSVTA